MSDAILFFSKPITYAVTLSELGEEVVHKYQVQIVPKYEKKIFWKKTLPFQGREPSGRKINEIVLDYNSEFSGGKANYKLKFILLLKQTSPTTL